MTALISRTYVSGISDSEIWVFQDTCFECLQEKKEEVKQKLSNLGKRESKI